MTSTSPAAEAMASNSDQDNRGVPPGERILNFNIYINMTKEMKGHDGLIISRRTRDRGFLSYRSAYYVTNIQYVYKDQLTSEEISFPLL